MSSRQQLLQELQQKLAVKEEKNRCEEYAPPPRYDEVFWEGIKYLDDLAHLDNETTDQSMIQTTALPHTGHGYLQAGVVYMPKTPK